MSDPKGTLVVTGSSRGIGAAIALAAAGKGYAVAVNFSSDRAGAQAVVESIWSGGGKAEAIQADVSAERDVKALFAEAARLLGPITGLVNNAGISGKASRLETMDAEDIARVFAVNVSGAMLCSREAVRHMSERNGGKGGGIVNISSRAAEIGGAGEWLHYAASKGAIDTFTIGLSREVAAEGIRVNAVAPGLIDTTIHEPAGGASRLERLRSFVPMNRIGTAEEVAQAVIWLLSPQASYITGAILPIGGGR